MKKCKCERCSKNGWGRIYHPLPVVWNVREPIGEPCECLERLYWAQKGVDPVLSCPCTRNEILSSEELEFLKAHTE